MKFPYKGWVLTPQMTAKEITFTSMTGEHSWWQGYFAEGGKGYSVNDIYKTKAAALEAAQINLDKQEAKINKLVENWEKKSSNVQKQLKEFAK